MRIQPTRDWRFWGLLTVFLFGVIILVSLIVTLGRAGDVRDENAQLQETVRVLQATTDGLLLQNTELKAAQDAQGDAATCRSRANFDTTEASADLQIVIGEGLAAAGRREGLDQLIDALTAKSAALRAALDAQRKAVEDCAAEATP